MDASPNRSRIPFVIVTIETPRSGWFRTSILGSTPPRPMNWNVFAPTLRGVAGNAPLRANGVPTGAGANSAFG